MPQATPKRSVASGQSTWQVYDAAGQVTHGINTLGEVSESRYDAAGRLLYSRMMGRPDKVYGISIGSSYQKQGAMLSKQFKRPAG